VTFLQHFGNKLGLDKEKYLTLRANRQHPYESFVITKETTQEYL